MSRSEPSNPSEIKPPAHLSRGEKHAFRRIVRQLIAAEAKVSEAQTDLICDLIECRGRLTKLNILFADRSRSMSTAYAPALVQLSAQINATTAVAHRIAKRLGL